MSEPIRHCVIGSLPPTTYSVQQQSHSTGCSSNMRVTACSWYSLQRQHGSHYLLTPGRMVLSSILSIHMGQQLQVTEYQYSNAIQALALEGGELSRWQLPARE